MNGIRNTFQISLPVCKLKLFMYTVDAAVVTSKFLTQCSRLYQTVWDFLFLRYQVFCSFQTVCDDKTRTKVCSVHYCTLNGDTYPGKRQFEIHLSMNGGGYAIKHSDFYHDQLLYYNNILGLSNTISAFRLGIDGVRFTPLRLLTSS